MIVIVTWLQSHLHYIPRPTPSKHIMPCPSLHSIGVSCDACGKGSFSGKRYKCLVCYDFDLCAECYETGETGTGRHATTHPMQCILTRVDTGVCVCVTWAYTHDLMNYEFKWKWCDKGKWHLTSVRSFFSISLDLFFGGENHSSEQTTSFTCPLCGQVGFSEAGLREHVIKHSDPSMLQEVICPVCAAHPSGDPNHLTDDLPAHLSMEHRAFRDMEISFHCLCTFNVQICSIPYVNNKGLSLCSPWLLCTKIQLLFRAEWGDWSGGGGLV